MSVTVTVRGKDKLFAKLKQLAPAADKALTDASQKSAGEMVAAARSFVPVRTGKLRESIVATPAGQSPPAYAQGAPGVVPAGAVMVTAGNSEVRYAHLVEFGAKAHPNEGIFAGTQNPGSPAQPFFFPAYRLIRKKHRGRATRALNKSIKEVAAK